MSNNNQQLTFKKSVLSIVMISAFSGGLIALEQYHAEPERGSTRINALLESAMISTDLQQPAVITEADLSTDEQPESELPLAQLEQENSMPTAAQQIAAEVAQDQAEEVVQKNSDKQAVIENSVLFAFASSEIAPSYYQSLNATAKAIKEANSDEQMLWQVVGYADQTGNALYNARLAEKRAQAVAEFLVSKGVAEQQLAIVSLGDSRPQYAAADKGKAYLDRRVEIHAYQAEISALAAQLNPPNAEQQLPQAENNKALANSLPLKTSLQQPLPGGFYETAQPLSTAMEF